MYTSINFKSKKALKESILKGDKISVFQPGPFPGKNDGVIYLEGPHYPAPHSWYASAKIENGYIIPGSVK